MKEDLVKTKFNSPGHEVLFKIKRTNDWLDFWQTEFLKNFNISPEQYDVLHGISGAYILKIVRNHFAIIKKIVN